MADWLDPPKPQAPDPLPPTNPAEGSLYVTGLPKGVSEEQVNHIFSEYGIVRSVKVLPPRNDKPGSAVIISMVSADRAKFLVQKVSGTIPNGLTEPIDIRSKMTWESYDNSWQTDQWSTGYGGYGKGGYGSYAMYQMPPPMPDPWTMQMMWMQDMMKGGKGGKDGKTGLINFSPEKKIWVAGLPQEGVTFRELLAHFPGAKFASIMTGKGAGSGGVAFNSEQEANEAIASYNGTMLMGKVIEVDKWVRPKRV